MRRNLRATIKTGEQALLAIDIILEVLQLVFEHGLAAESDLPTLRLPVAFRRKSPFLYFLPRDK
jgi:hypothetical protein